MNPTRIRDPVQLLLFAPQRTNRAQRLDADGELDRTSTRADRHSPSVEDPEVTESQSSIFERDSSGS
jgi:hypothetical protein